MTPKAAAVIAVTLVLEAFAVATGQPPEKSSTSTGYSGVKSEHPFLPDNTEELRASALPERQTTVLTGRTLAASAAFVGNGSMAVA